MSGINVMAIFSYCIPLLVMAWIPKIGYFHKNKACRLRLNRVSRNNNNITTRFVSCFSRKNKSQRHHIKNTFHLKLTKRFVFHAHLHNIAARSLIRSKCLSACLPQVVINMDVSTVEIRNCCCSIFWLWSLCVI